jgi:hypothetical protein
MALFFGMGYAPAAAQNYRFQVEKMELQVYVQPDASARLEYTIVFNNRGKAIDIVDIGLPHDGYDLKSMSASIDGHRLGTFRRSEYIDVGVEVPLGGHKIRPGKKGTFVFACIMPDMVYRDPTDSQRASIQIKPTWFDPSLQFGTTDLSILVNVPPGVGPKELTWHSDQLAYNRVAVAGQGDEKRAVAFWSFPGHTLSANNPKVGLSFPRRVMKRVVKISALGLLVKWFRERPGLQLVSGIVLCIAVGIVFFRFSGGTGFVVFFLLAVILFFIMVNSPGLHLAMWPVAIGLAALNEWGRSRRSTYLPALATVEGGGIKRGLTAPQAALLLELPLSKVLTLVVFGMLKKGVLRQVSLDPLIVEVDTAFRTSRSKRGRAAAERGIVLHSYEQPFVDLLVGWDKPVADRDFSQAVGKVIKSLAGQMKGFDLSDTQEYYRRIVSRAWKEAESIGELRRRDEVVERNFDWMMLDPDCQGRFDAWGRGGYHYHPTWTLPGGGGGGSAPRAPVPSSQTSFGEVASSFAGWAENTAGNLASAVEPSGLGVDMPSGGFLDLSGVDRVTGDIITAMAESGSSGGGGGGGGCACACAGCACACACAGGGR